MPDAIDLHIENVAEAIIMGGLFSFGFAVALILILPLIAAARWAVRKARPKVAAVITVAWRMLRQITRRRQVTFTADELAGVSPAAASPVEAMHAAAGMDGAR